MSLYRKIRGAVKIAWPILLTLFYAYKSFYEHMWFVNTTRFDAQDSKNFLYKIWRKVLGLLAFISASIIFTIPTILLLILFPQGSLLYASFHAWFQPVDNIMDGEVDISPENLQKYIEETGRTIEMYYQGHFPKQFFKGRNRILLLINSYAEKIGAKEVFQKYIKDIWETMLIEHEWRTKKIVPTEAELMRVSKMEDEAIFSLAAMVMGIPYHVLEQFSFYTKGLFIRGDWLKDTYIDLKSGLVHLSKETCERLQITYSDLVGNILPETRKKIEEHLATELTTLRGMWEDIEKDIRIFRTYFSSQLKYKLLFEAVIFKTVRV